MGWFLGYKEYSSQLEVQVFDIAQADVLSQALAFQPLGIILEAERSQHHESCSLEHVLTTFPNVIVIYMHLGESEVQVILSEQFIASGVRELIEVLHPFDDHPRKAISRPTPIKTANTVPG